MLASTTGDVSDLYKRASGAANIPMITINVYPPGIFFLHVYNNKWIKYPAINPGKFPNPDKEADKYRNTQAKLLMPKGTKIGCATPPRLPFALPTLFLEIQIFQYISEES